MTKPQLTAIEGGRKGPTRPPDPPDHDAEFARQHLEQLTIEILRALARGEDHRARVVGQLAHVTEHLGRTVSTFGEIVQPVMRKLNERLSEGGDGYDEEVSSIVLASLQFAAESCCDDNAARGRVAQREDDLRRAIDRHILGHETRARKNGGRSYLLDLVKKHFSKSNSKWKD